MKLRKLGYYARCSAELWRALENPLALAAVAAGRDAELRLRDGPAWRIDRPLDALLLVETVLHDAYGLDRLRDPACLVDVGAGIGEFCVAAAHRFPAARILAFEPHPEQVERLRENLARNGAAGVVAEPIAIGTASPLELGLHRARARSSTQRSGGRPLRVEARPLSDFVTEPVDLLKVDCEGAELDVIESLGPALDRVRAAAVETHGPDVAAALRRHLEAHGFRCRWRADPWDAALGMLEAVRG